MMVLQIMQDLMVKCQETFLEHFARLGLFSRVHHLAGPLPHEESGAKPKGEKAKVLREHKRFIQRLLLLHSQLL